MSRREFPGPLIEPPPNRTSLPGMYTRHDKDSSRTSLPGIYTRTDDDNKLRHLPPMPPQPPPAKRYKSDTPDSSQRHPSYTPDFNTRHASYTPDFNTRHPSYTPESASHRKVSCTPDSDRRYGPGMRQGSAMDLYTMIDRNPVNTDPRRSARLPSTDSIATDASLSSNPSQLMRNSAVIPNPRFCENGDTSPYKENGRLYHGYRKGIYPLPCDEPEQDRLDLFHKLFTVARTGDGLLYAPTPKNPNILDLGCGTGIWCQDIAAKIPDAAVVGCDLVAIQPKPASKNCDFYAPFDFESPWELGENHWDVIHMQLAAGSVTSWPSLYSRIYKHLRPGAWFEQVEIDFRPRCEDNDPGRALSSWYSTLRHATESTMRPIAHSSKETIQNLQDAGFTDIDHQIVGLPLNPWHTDEHEKKVARWYNLALSESVHVLSLAPFTRVLGWTREQVDRIAEDVKQDALNKNNCTFNLLHIYQAKKPAASLG